jgi:hypothetical protein
LGDARLLGDGYSGTRRGIHLDVAERRGLHLAMVFWAFSLLFVAFSVPQPNLKQSNLEEE